LLTRSRHGVGCNAGTYDMRGHTLAHLHTLVASAIATHPRLRAVPPAVALCEACAVEKVTP
jgi:hypothetical protein